jgi:CheY-like chemotaxis protein/predicted transcriptional regulator
MHLELIGNNTLGSFSFDVIERMLNVLVQHGRSMKKTNLASKAGLNYNVCLRYILMLSSLRWVEVKSEVRITDIGKGVFANLIDISEVIASTGNDIWPGNQREESIAYSRSSYVLPSTQINPLPASSFVTEKQSVSQSKQNTGNENKNKKKTIMIVDDEEDIAQIYKNFLSSVGYQVRTFIDSRSALHEYVSNPFLYDLLILDIRMQEINGLQLYQSIKAINPECRAIFVSCLDAAREVVSILPGMKPRDIIRKPASKEQFVTAVKSALI